MSKASKTPPAFEQSKARVADEEAETARLRNGTPRERIRAVGEDIDGALSTVANMPPGVFTPDNVREYAAQRLDQILEDLKAILRKYPAPPLPILTDDPVRDLKNLHAWCIAHGGEPAAGKGADGEGGKPADAMTEPIDGTMLTLDTLWDLAGHNHVTKAALGKALERWRYGTDKGWSERGDRSHNEAKYLYEWPAVRVVIDRYRCPSNVRPGGRA